jgi:hypothetical protein
MDSATAMQRGDGGDEAMHQVNGKWWRDVRRKVEAMQQKVT